MLLYFIILLVLTAYVQTETCPTFEGIGFSCSCEEVEDTGYIDIDCSDGDDTGQLEKLSGHLTGKKNMDLHLFKFDMDKLPSSFFHDVDVKRLKLEQCTFRNFTQEDGSPRFSHLENSLEVLTITGSLRLKTDQDYLNLRHLKKLVRLELWMNAIPNLSNDWFKSGPTSLKYLALFINQIKYLGNAAFKNLVNLEKLELQGNYISELKRSMFPIPAQALSYLDLHVNELRSLPGDLFSGMESLSVINIANNKIKRFQKSTWIPVWENLEEFVALDNPLVCDSHLDWMIDYRLPIYIHCDCKEPFERKGKSLRTFIESRRKIFK